MNTILNSEYEDLIEKIIKQHGCAQVSKGLRFLVNELYQSNKSVASFFQQPQIIRDKITLTGGLLRIKSSDLKGIVGEYIVHNLKESSTKDRAQIIYKFLCNCYFGNWLKTIDQLREDLSVIDSGQFPYYDESHKKEGKDDGKYRSLGKIFSDKKHVGNDYTLKVGISILGIKLDSLDHLLSEFFNEEETEPHTPEPVSIIVRNKTRKPLYAAASLVATSIILYFFIPSTPSNDTEPISFKEKLVRPKIESHQLFGSARPIPENSLFQDSLVLEVYPPLYNRFVGGENPIAVDTLWLPFRFVNYSSQTCFPDGIYLKHINSTVMSGGIEESPSLVQTEKAPLLFDIPSKLEWIIINTNELPSIPAKHQVRGLIKIVASEAKGERVLAMKLAMKLHSVTNDWNVETKQNFRIALSQ